jgi:Arc/MetJ-type ribon-helix-helix transcriptional regulator
MTMSKVLFDHRLSVGVTDKMNALLEDIAIARTRRGSPISKSELIREAIRLYLDDQADASRLPNHWKGRWKLSRVRSVWTGEIGNTRSETGVTMGA